MKVEIETEEDWAHWRALRELSGKRGELEEEEEEEKKVECGWTACGRWTDFGLTLLPSIVVLCRASSGDRHLDCL